MVICITSGQLWRLYPQTIKTLRRKYNGRLLQTIFLHSLFKFYIKSYVILKILCFTCFVIHLVSHTTQFRQNMAAMKIRKCSLVLLIVTKEQMPCLYMFFIEGPLTMVSVQVIPMYIKMYPTVSMVSSSMLEIPYQSILGVFCHRKLLHLSS